ncbi:MAG: hypothetical protein IGS39_07185 [Calothrix sp. C42_A2020_038]|nr:hypothetical protein [Calothrix sp. C42_A2020_038]
MDLKEICPIENSIPKRSFETFKYKAYICLGDSHNSLGYYVRVTKSDNVKITLPITQRNGETYLAKSREITHVASPYELLINKSGRIINRERVINAVSANGQPLTSTCPQGENILIEAVTRNFIIYICGSDQPGSYVGVTRMGNERVILPLQLKPSGATEKQKYLAVKGNTRFLLTRDKLQIVEGNKVIIKEKILQWQ